MKTGNEAISIARHISGFLNEYAPTRRTGSENTLKAYQDSIGLYLQFLEQNGTNSKNLSAACFGKDKIEEWMDWLRTERGNQAETCNNRLASLRVFLEYLGHKDISLLYLFEDSLEVKRFKTQKKKVEGITRPAIEALLAAPDQTTHTGRRDFMLMMILYNTAARIDEILSLKVGQIHLEARNPYANIVGKGNKIRTAFLLPRTVAYLKKYLKEFHQCHAVKMVKVGARWKGPFS